MFAGASFSLCVFLAYRAANMPIYPAQIEHANLPNLSSPDRTCQSTQSIQPRSNMPIYPIYPAQIEHANLPNLSSPDRTCQSTQSIQPRSNMPIYPIYPAQIEHANLPNLSSPDGTCQSIQPRSNTEHSLCKHRVKI